MEGAPKSVVLKSCASMATGLMVAAGLTSGARGLHRTEAAKLPNAGRGHRPQHATVGRFVRHLSSAAAGPPEVKGSAQAHAGTFVWGTALNEPAAYVGLQIEIGLSPRDKHAYKAGDAVRVILKAHNGGKAPITISYYERVPLFGLVVEDQQGKRVRLLGGVRPEDLPKDLEVIGMGEAPWRQRTLNPGEEVELGSVQLDFLAPKGELNSWPRLLVSNPAMPAVPGTYRLSYVSVCLNMPKASHNFDLMTGQTRQAVRRDDGPIAMQFIQPDAVVASTGSVAIEVRKPSGGRS